MKKLLISLGLCVAACGAMAQSHVVQDVLNVRALNVGTNTWGVTNLANLVTNIGMIYNPTNLSYTNLAGNYVGTASAYLSTVGTTTSLTGFSVFKDVSLWSDRNGVPIYYTLQPLESTVPPGYTNITYMSAATLFIEYVNPLGTNAPFGMTFRPVWDGVTPSTSTADDWGFRIAGATTTKGTLSTNVPLWKWPGAKALRVVAVTNQYILAGGGTAGLAQSNSTFITKLKLTGFIP